MYNYEPEKPDPNWELSKELGHYEGDSVLNGANLPVIVRLSSGNAAGQGGHPLTTHRFARLTYLYGLRPQGLQQLGDFNYASCPRMFTPLIDGFLGAVVGSLITAAVILWQTRRTERREARSVAMALLWEIDDFYKLCIRDMCRTLKDRKPTDPLPDMKSIAFRRFTIYEATADKVGLYEPVLVEMIVGWHGLVSAYLDTLDDYRRTVERIQEGQRTLHNKALMLLHQITGTSKTIVPLTRTICGQLAARAKAEYTFEIPYDDPCWK